jgi:hypothetical protein
MFSWKNISRVSNSFGDDTASSSWNGKQPLSSDDEFEHDRFVIPIFSFLFSATTGSIFKLLLASYSEIYHFYFYQIDYWYLYTVKFTDRA